MIRRHAIALLFATLGLASLLFLGFIEARLCELLPALQHCRSEFNGCGLDCSQSWSLAEQIKAFLFFFSPSIVFAITAFAFSKRPHRAFVWVALLVGLVAVHAALLLAGYAISK